MGSLAWGMPGILMESVFRMKRSLQRLMDGLVHPYFMPPSNEFAISRTKRGGAWSYHGPVVSFKPHQSDQYLYCQNAECWLPDTPSPSTSSFLPLIQQGGSRKCPKECAELPVYLAFRCLICLVLGWQQTIHTLWYFLQSHCLSEFAPPGW